MADKIHSISEIQEAVKTELEENTYFAQHGIPILCENSKTIEFEIKNAMASLGIVATVATPSLAYRGLCSGKTVTKYGVQIPTDMEVGSEEVLDDAVYDCADIDKWGDNPPEKVSAKFPCLGDITVNLSLETYSTGPSESSYFYLAPTSVRPLVSIELGYTGDGQVYAKSESYGTIGRIHLVSLNDSKVPLEEGTVKDPFWEINTFNIVIVENPTLNRGRANYATALDTALQIAYTIGEIPNVGLGNIQQSTQGGLVVVTVSAKSNIGFMLEKEMQG